MFEPPSIPWRYHTLCFAFLSQSATVDVSVRAVAYAAIDASSVGAFGVPNPAPHTDRYYNQSFTFELQSGAVYYSQPVEISLFLLLLSSNPTLNNPTKQSRTGQEFSSGWTTMIATRTLALQSTTTSPALPHSSHIAAAWKRFVFSCNIFLQTDN